jgi:hypothetical protein
VKRVAQSATRLLAAAQPGISSVFSYAKSAAAGWRSAAATAAEHLAPSGAPADV